MTFFVRNLVLLASVSLCILGCGGESTPPPKSEAIGSQAKQQVQDLVAEAKKNPAKASQSVAMLNESLAAYANDYGQEFETLKAEGQKLQELYEKKAPKAEIDAQLMKLNDAANALPN